MNHKKIFILFFLHVVFFSFAQQIYNHASVVCAKKDVADLAIKVIKDGGNAFDAMVVTELGLAASYPFAGSLGGGGFMVYRTKESVSGCLNFREKAPKKASKDMFLDNNGNVIVGKSTDSGLAIGVPGNIAGIYAAHEKFGKLPMKNLLKRVIRFIEKGFIITEYQAKSLNKTRKDFDKNNLEKIFYSREWKAGEICKNIALAKTLKRILKNGKDEFYKGETAKKIVEFTSKNGGILSMEDLSSYTVEWQKPIEVNYKDFKVFSMSPPSSGGIALGQMLKIAEGYKLNTFKHNSNEYIQLLTEIERRVYADRAYFLGDPNFVKVPIAELLSDEYAKERMKDFSWEKATLSSAVSHGNIPGFEHDETTHYSIVDSDGNAVAVTTTINGAYGSKLYSNDLGFFFNNQMDDFSIKPGTPNLFGLVGGYANQIEPGKRMLSSMTPTIVEKKGKLFMVLGSPGGSTIITSVFQNILNVTEFNMGMQESVSAARFHHQWLPDEIRVENSKGFIDKDLEILRNKGYHLVVGESVVVGKVDAILVKDGKLESGADPRGDDAASGF